MEKGLKSLLAIANTAERKSRGDSGDSFDEQGSMGAPPSDADSNFGSDAEMDVEHDNKPSGKSSPRHTRNDSQQTYHQEHVRSRSLPQPIASQLPLYQPPPPIITNHPQMFDAPRVTSSPATLSFARQSVYPRYTPEYHNGRGGISIQAVLSPAEPQFA